jgi:hypothetical protein
MIRKASLLLSFITVVSALQAAPLTYNLSFNFAVDSGNLLPTGSFTYDSSLAVNPFSSFTVAEGGLLFDLRNAANGFTGNSLVGACKSSQSAAGFFNGLTGADCIGSWNTFSLPMGFAQFNIFVCSISGTPCNDGSVFNSSQGTIPPLNGGLLTATAAAAAPEPGALWLCGIGMAALISRAWATRKIRNA